MNEIISISALHVVYLIGIIVVLAVMAMKKDTIILCIGFIFLIGFIQLGSFVGGVQSIYNALLFAGKKFMDIILTISLITALAKCLRDLGSDRLIMRPGERAMKTPTSAFWITGITMMIFSYFLWPSPAVALVGAVLLPVAIKAGLTPMGAAIAMNIFGHGIALSSDFLIQGAPSITAKAAGVETSDIISKGMPLFLTMAIVTALLSYFLNRKVLVSDNKNEIQENDEKGKTSKATVIMAVATPAAFLIVIGVLLVCGINGGEATGLISGTAVVLMVLGTALKYKKDSLEKITDYLKDGFIFGIKIFVPVIVIGAFFFLGGDEMGEMIGIASSDRGILNDWALWLTNAVSLNKYSVATLEVIVGMISGLDGSGFSGLPITGALAGTFGSSLSLNVPVLAALGQITTIWVGGGVLVPWALIPAAAICGVEPVELARRNFMPVILGIGAMLIVSFIFI